MARLDRRHAGRGIQVISEPSLKPLSGKGAASFHRSQYAGNLWEGSVRSGKTVGSILRWIQFIRSAPKDGDLCMIGRTERTLKRNVIDTMVKYLGRQRCRLSAGSGELEVLGRTVYLSGANDDRAAEKIQGMTLAGWYGDEMSTWPQSVFNMARSRLSVDGAKWFGTANPAGPNHWLMADLISKARYRILGDGSVQYGIPDGTSDLAVFSFRLDDNPWLPTEFVAALKREYVGMFYRRFILGEWCMADGAIYDAWDPDRHVIPAGKVPGIERWVAAGIDYGTNNPFHAVMLGIGPAPFGAGKCLYVTGEYRHDGRATRARLTDSEYGERLMSWMAEHPIPQGGDLRGVQPHVICVDPSATSFRVQLYRSGLRTVAADNSVLDGIRLNASLIARGRLLVSDACPGLIAEIPGYSWDAKAAKTGEDKPIKVNDHGCDAMRYASKTTEPIWRPAVGTD